MPTFHSDAWTLTPAALPTVPRRAASGEGHSRLRVWRAKITAPVTAAADVIRVMPLNSSDRILAMYVSTAAAIVGEAVADVGLHLAGANHDGAVVDANLFDDDQDLAATNDRVEFFAAAALLGIQRGDPIWSLLGLSADPALKYELSVTTVTGISTGGVIAYEIHYVSGD